MRHEAIEFVFSRDFKSQLRYIHIKSLKVIKHYFSKKVNVLATKVRPKMLSN